MKELFAILLVTLISSTSSAQDDLKTYGSDTLKSSKCFLVLSYTSPYQKLIVKDSISDLHGYEFIIEGWIEGVSPSNVCLSGSGCSLSSLGNGKYLAKFSTGTRKGAISVHLCKKYESMNGMFRFNLKGNLPKDVK